uniref:Uncharacterized protein n=1 Tax=viral metagenome TaxID=1070528 RepID=A0A6C0IV42_9ZZZZ
MEICPIGFFCFNKNTFLLLVLLSIVVIIYFININKHKLENDRFVFETKISELDKLKNKIETTDEKINFLNQTTYKNTYEQERLYNPLLGPERSFPYSLNKLGLPINIKTRGDIPNYQQVGVLYQNGNDKEKKIFPLYGKPTYPGSRRWLYYTGNDNFSSVKLPIDNNGRSCQDQNGCDELNNDEEISVVGYNDKFKVNIYNLDKPKYIPYII